MRSATSGSFTEGTAVQAFELTGAFGESRGSILARFDRMVPWLGHGGIRVVVLADGLSSADTVTSNK